MSELNRVSNSNSNNNKNSVNYQNDALEQQQQQQQKQQQNSNFDGNATNDDIEENNSSANNSIIGLVKSRVSSILPTSFSKWFSHSNKNNNETMNGSIASVCSPARRRRRYEVDDDDDEDDDDDDDDDDEDDDDDDVDDDDGGGEAEDVTLDEQTIDQGGNNVKVQREHNAQQFNLNNYNALHSNRLRKSSNRLSAPPSKRACLNIENTQPSYLNNSIMAREPLYASTPPSRPTSSDLFSQRFKYAQPYRTDGGNAYVGTQHSNRSIVDNGREEEEEEEITNAAVAEDADNNLSSFQNNQFINNDTRQSYGRVAADDRYHNTTNQTYNSWQSSQQERPYADEVVEHDHEEGDEEEQTEAAMSQQYNFNGCTAAFLNNSRMFAGNNKSNSSSRFAGGGGSTASSENSEHLAGKIRRNFFNRNQETGSCTSSLGNNSIHFDSHLEGRKSLFGRTAPSINNSKSFMNNSTMSLNSLNRRQFNASIYGSTSALSDSRLLNTFSPFYKGRTTYGGAAAYNKSASNVNTGAGIGGSVRSHRVAPVIMRPTSTNSNDSQTSADNNIPISSLAQSILKMINDISTPLSEVEEMASNLKEKKSNTYSRHKINTNGKELPSPPKRGLQVPTMAQLLSMKTLYTSSERTLDIVRKQKRSDLDGILSTKTEYKLPPTNDEKVDGQKFTSKIKNKMNAVHRLTNTKDYGHNDDIVEPVNLQNIPFPLMTAAPVIDINISKVPALDKSNAFNKKNSSTSLHHHDDVNDKGDNDENDDDDDDDDVNVPLTNFKFSSPIRFSKTSAMNSIPLPKMNYQFSPPIPLTNHLADKPKVISNIVLPTLKTGSVLDALKTPLIIPNKNSITTNTTNNNNILNNNLNNFGTQFKKSTDEWECPTCMIRNKQSITNCIACNTAAPTTTKTATTTAAAAAPASSTPSSTFGSQFKKSTNEWECSVCMIRNKNETNKCVACETPRSSKDVNNDVTKMPALPLSNTTNLFGDAFKPKVGTWECNICLVNNKSDALECVACQAKKPGSDTPQTTSIQPPPPTTKANAFATFKFGFGPQTAAATVPPPPSPPEEPWVCEACMSRNNRFLKKCICCEQEKPGTTKNDAGVFKFGTTAAEKYNIDQEKSATSAADTKKTEILSNVTTINFDTKTSTGNDMLDTTGKPLTTINNFKFGASENKTVDKDGFKGFKFGSSQTSTGGFSIVTNATSNDAKKELSSKVEINFNAPKSTSSEVAAPAAENAAGATLTKSTNIFSFGVPTKNATATVPTSPAPAPPMFNFNMAKTSDTTTSSSSSLSTNSTIPFPTTQSTASAFTGKSIFDFTSSTQQNYGGFGSLSTKPITTFSTTGTPAFSLTSGNDAAADKKEVVAQIAPAAAAAATTTATATNPTTTSTSIFGNANMTFPQQQNVDASKPFTFGSNQMITSTSSILTTATSAPGVTSPISSPFVFGGAGANKTPSESIFSCFGGFGATSQSAATTTVGTAPPPSTSTSIFGGTSAATALNNMFGGNNAANNMQMQSTPPAFGNQLFTFGNAAQQSPPKPQSLTNPSNPLKRTEPPFSFNPPQANAANASTGFVFENVKPAFNFTATQQPTFNFTGNAQETKSDTIGSTDECTNESTKDSSSNEAPTAQIEVPSDLNNSNSIKSNSKGKNNIPQQYNDDWLDIETDTITKEEVKEQNEQQQQQQQHQQIKTKIQQKNNNNKKNGDHINKKKLLNKYKWTKSNSNANNNAVAEKVKKFPIRQQQSKFNQNSNIHYQFRNNSSNNNYIKNNNASDARLQTHNASNITKINKNFNYPKQNQYNSRYRLNHTNQPNHRQQRSKFIIDKNTYTTNTNTHDGEK